MAATSALERDSELVLLRSRLQQAAAGHGSTVVVAGPAGIGRSFLLGQVRDQAQAAGWTVLDTRCTPASGRHAFGVLRDWFGGLALRAPAGQPPFDGPASALIALAHGEPVETGDVVYGVRRLLDHLASEGPLLLVADDLHWADVGSVEVLELLVTPVRQLSCAVVAAVRSGEPTDAAEPLRRLAASADQLTLQAWSRRAVRERVRTARRERAVAQAVRLAGPRGPEPVGDKVSRELEHTDLLMRRTGGVPFLVEQLLEGETGPGGPVGAGVVASVAERCARIGPTAASTARAVSVLGGYAGLASVAELTGTSVEQVADDVSALVDAHLLVHDGPSLRVRQPLVGEALVAMLGASESSRLHRRTAQVLSHHGAGRTDVARRLLATLPSGDETVRAQLRDQGDRWLAEDRPELAIRYFERAVSEGPLTETDVDLLATLGRVHAAAGRLDQALSLWSRARELATDPAVDDGLRSEAGNALSDAGRHREARQMLGSRSSSPVSGTPSTVERRQARLALAGLLSGVSVDFLHQQVAPALAHPPSGATADERLSLVAAAAVTTFQAKDATTARELCLRAVAEGLSADDASEAGMQFLSAGVLLWTSTYVEAEALTTSTISDAESQGSPHRRANASVCRGLVRLRMGLVGQAERDLESALVERDHGWTAYLAPLLAGLVECRLARGDLDRAAELRDDLDELTHSPGLAGSYATYALAEIASATGDPDRAAHLYSQVGRLVEGRMDNPAVLPWRVGEALSRVHLGQPRAAAHLARANLTLAETFGAPYPMAEALRTLAAVDPTADRVRLLRRALRSLRGLSAARLEAQVATDLAGMLVLTGNGEETGEPSVLLRRAESYASFQELGPLADRVQRLLERLGEPVRRTAAESVELLTPSERKVAELAASGLSNRQIAQRLYVTVKAVEWHLSHTYRKLGIRSRHRLSAVLDSVDR